MVEKVDRLGEVVYKLGYSTRFQDGGYCVVDRTGKIVVGPCGSLEDLAEEVVR